MLLLLVDILGDPTHSIQETLKEYQNGIAEEPCLCHHKRRRSPNIQNVSFNPVNYEPQLPERANISQNLKGKLLEILMHL